MKGMITSLVVAVLIATPTTHAWGENAPTRLSRLNPVVQAQQHPIVFDRPAISFFEGAVLGNGGLGVVVSTRPDAVVLYFGHNDVWDIRLAENNREKIGTFRELYDKILAIPDTVGSLGSVPWFKEYIDMARENYAKPYPRPFPCGSVVLWFDRRTAELLGHRIDIDRGLCRIAFLIDSRRCFLEVFTDMSADRLWARMVDDAGKPIPAPFVYLTVIPDPETPREFPESTAARDDAAGVLSFRQVLPLEEITDAPQYKPHEKDRAFRLTARVGTPFDTRGTLAEERGYTDSIIQGQPLRGALKGMIDPTKEFTLCIQLDNGVASQVGSSPGEAPIPSAQTFDDAAQLSKDVWETYWNKSGVSVDDDVLERTWYHNQYFLRCAVRPGVTCPGLFANWSFRSIGTAWHGDYHMNYNTQQPFWGTFSSNHVDLHLPYVDMIEHTLLPVSKRWAEEYYEMRGAFFPHSAYPVEMTMMPYPVPTWGWEVFETPWSVQSLWWQYLYTQDREFLRERALGIIREAVLFLVDYMKRPEAHGDRWGDDDYHIFPSVPPELYGLQPGFDKNYDTIADLTLTKFVFRAYLEACDILDIAGQEHDLMRDVRDILEHLPTYPTARSERGTVFVSVEGEDPETVYNVPASLMTVFPGEDHGLHSPPDEFALAATTFRNQQNEGGNDLVFLNLQAARLGMLDLEKFKRQITYCLMPNGTCTDKVLQIHGRYSNNTPFDFMAHMGMWFENFSLPAVINECLLQSYNGELRFFPNWTGDKDAEFRTLRAVGAFLVSAKWSDGKVAWVEVLSEAGAPLNIISPWTDGARYTRSTRPGRTETVSGDRFTIETSPGDVLQFQPPR